MRRTGTREIFQVNFRTSRGRTWSVFGNHWPSRSGGQLESAGYRTIAGETLAYFHERVAARSTGRRPRRWRWATSTTSRSTRPWSTTR